MISTDCPRLAECRLLTLCGAVMGSYALSRHEPAALGRTISLVEDELSTEAAGTPLDSRDTPKALAVSQSLHPPSTQYVAQSLLRPLPVHSSWSNSHAMAAP